MIKKLSYLIVIAFFAVSCGSKTDSKIVGKWSVSKVEMAKADNAAAQDSMTAAINTMAADILSKTFEKLSFDFKNDGSCEVAFNDEKETDSYTLSEDNKTLSFKGSSDMDMKVIELGDDKLVLQPTNKDAQSLILHFSKSK